jgi:hypothetical protein
VESNWRQTCVRLFGVQYRYTLAAKILAGVFTGKYLVKDLPQFGVASIWDALPSGDPLFYQFVVIDPAHPHFPYGYSVELDQL